MSEFAVVRFAVCTECGGIRSGTIDHICDCAEPYLTRQHKVVQPSPVMETSGDSSSRKVPSDANSTAAGDDAARGFDALMALAKDTPMGMAYEASKRPALTREQARMLLAECERYSDHVEWPEWEDEDGKQYDRYRDALAALRRIAGEDV